MPFGYVHILIKTQLFCFMNIARQARNLFYYSTTGGAPHLSLKAVFKIATLAIYRHVWQHCGTEIIATAIYLICGDNGNDLSPHLRLYSPPMARTVVQADVFCVCFAK